MDNNLNSRQIEVDSWIRSKLDVEEYAWLLESCGSIDNFVCFLDDLVNKINEGHHLNVIEFRVCDKLGLITQGKIKTIADVKMELQKSNAKFAELEEELRTCDDKLQCERRLMDIHGYIEALWWVLGKHKSLAES